MIKIEGRGKDEDREGSGGGKENLVKSVPEGGHVELSYLSARDQFVRPQFPVSQVQYFINSWRFFDLFIDNITVLVPVIGIICRGGVVAEAKAVAKTMVAVVLVAEVTVVRRGLSIILGNPYRI